MTDKSTSSLSSNSQKDTAHTPGPWRLCFHLESPENDASCPCGYRGGIWSGDGESLVCEMGGTPDCYGEQVYPQPDRQTTLVNARLISAAPQLLQATKFLVEFIEANDELDVFQVEDVLEYQAAKSAIAKAEGK